MAMLGDSDAASECVRISFGRPTTKPDIESAVQMLRDAVTYVRTLT
jgi:cysteine sulfinate desulfinase/cysteine desulfurase-like protein